MSGELNRQRWFVRWRRWLIAAVILVLAAVGWRVFNKPVPPPPPPSALVDLADITQTVQAAGLVQPRHKVDVGAQVTGQVRTVHVQLGQTVKKGDLLVSLDPELARNDVQQSEASLAQQEAALESRKVDLAQARREQERQRKLMAGEATARTELEQAEANVAKLELDLRGQTAVVGKLRADLASAKLRLGYTQIAAPTDGDVVSIAVQEGQTVNAQQQSPTLLTLAKLDTVTIKAQVAEADIGLVRIGQTASFITLGDSEHRHEGKVRLIQPLPDKINNAVFYNVLFDVPNLAVPPAGRPLMSDMSVQVKLQVAQAKQVAAIPMSSLGDKAPDGRYTVQVQAADGKTETRPVRVGVTDSSKVQVLEGVKKGEKVLLAPAPAASAASAGGGASVQIS
jgi:macrolide-specific efflux system membrane fusion protein